MGNVIEPYVLYEKQLKKAISGKVRDRLDKHWIGAHRLTNAGFNSWRGLAEAALDFDG